MFPSFRFCNARILFGVLFVAPALALAPVIPNRGSGGPDFDNQKGRWMDFGIGPLSPIAFSPDGSRLWTVNQPGSELRSFAVDDFESFTRAPIGPGVVSVAMHPTKDELWLVDRVMRTVSVVDPANGNTLRSIRVSAEPHGIVFTKTGDRAYVTASATDLVDVIDTATYSRVRSIPIPARNPRGIVRVGETIWVSSFLSGNGSAPRGNTDTGEVDDVRRVGLPDAGNGETPLPDRDLFAIRIGATPNDDALDLNATVSGLGTVLFNLRLRPGTKELWIPHTEALNAVFRGEKNFPAGQVVSNRIAIVDVSSGTPDPATDVRFIDLDQLAPEAKFIAATPTDVAFSSDGLHAFVCSFGNDLIAVLGIQGTNVSFEGVISTTPEDTYPDGSGPRTLAVSPNGSTLISFNKGSNSISRFSIANMPEERPFITSTQPALGLGWDPIPVDMVQGRVHFNRAGNSLSRTSSCGSCHVDGNTDGVVWDLGGFLDPEGTPSDQLSFPIDAKGPMVTQSVRRLSEVGPYHWRGEKRALVDFNSAFIGLLERVEGGENKTLGTDFRYVTQYMEHLAVPPNPRQHLRRIIDNEALAGSDIFLNKPVFEGMTCADCHSLPLGTSGEIVDNLGGLAPTIVVPSLRGVFEKLSPAFDIGGDYGTRTELGAGLGHSGAFSSIQALLLQEHAPPGMGQVFDVTPAEADLLAAYLEGFDTGLAPATAWQATVHAANHAGFLTSQLAFAIEQAELGHCDLIYRYGPLDWMGSERFFGGLYDPALGLFRQSSDSLPALTPAEVTELALQGFEVSFLGVPRMMGWPLAIDRDNDKLPDLDEYVIGTDHENEDSDDDEFPDGYEVLWGMDPLVPDQSSPDFEAPQLTSQVEAIFITTNAVKLEFTTDEPTRVLFSYNDGPFVLRAPLKPRFDNEFSEVLSELEPQTFYQVQLSMEDWSGNTTNEFFGFWTAPLAAGDPARITDWSATLLTSEGGGFQLESAFAMGLSSEEPAPGYEAEVTVYYISADESLYRDLGARQVTTDGRGLGRVSVGVPKDLPLGEGAIFVVVHSAEAPAGWPAYVEALDSASFVSVDF